ncbi:uncharacterized protein LOC131047285 isoform X2 [Cryptomeria japonica]|uniref:uncharacterized protein LOC131047285 isoform X2 n=1 Tax=Cryptomeria japonica TaxID=3369 RepID=UPI0027DA6FA8|nr:uncharacterized protein LOC131047285 isoform X2 [Cryptomeria japonica]
MATSSQELPPYDPFVKSTYTSTNRPQFLRYQPNRKDDDEDSPQSLRYHPSRKDDDEDFPQKYRGMERRPCSKIMIQILVVAFSVFIGCISTWQYMSINTPEELDLPINEYAHELGFACNCSKLYAGFNLQDLSEYADRFGLPNGKNSKELDPPINVYADELGFACNSSKLYAGLNLQALTEYAYGIGLSIGENSEELDLPINAYADELGFARNSSKLYAGLNLQALSEYADGFVLSIGGNSKELDLPITAYADELGLLISREESCLQITENTEEFSILIDGDEAHGLAVLEQFSTPEFERTYNFGTHSTILIGLSGTLALESRNRMETVTSEEKKAKEWVWDVFLAKDSKHLGAVCPLALLYAVTGAFFCAAAVVLNWSRKRATYSSTKSSLEYVKEIQAKINEHTQQRPFQQLSIMQRKSSSAPSVHLLNEYSVSSSLKKKDNKWNDSSIRGNSFYIPNQEARRKGNSAAATNQENMATGEIYMKNTSYGSRTTMAKKDVDEKKLKEIPTRRSNRISNRDIERKQLNAIPLRRSERIRNLTKSDCAHTRRHHA